MSAAMPSTQRFKPDGRYSLPSIHTRPRADLWTVHHNGVPWRDKNGDLVESRSQEGAWLLAWDLAESHHTDINCFSVVPTELPHGKADR